MFNHWQYQGCCLEEVNSLSAGKEAPHILPSFISATGFFEQHTSGQPESRDLPEEGISLTCCGHRHLVSTLVSRELPYAQAAEESVCKQGRAENVLL